MAAPSPIRDVLQAVGLAICREIVRLLDATGRQPLRSNSALRRQLLGGDAIKVKQGRSSGGQFAGYTATSSLELYALDYLQWVDSGRRKFAKKVPLDALIKFIKQRGIGQARGKGGRYGKRTISVNQLAFIIQAAIYRNGIRPRPVLAPAFELGQHLIDLYLDTSMLDGLTYELEQKIIYHDTKK